MEVEPHVTWSNNASFTIFLILANELALGEPFAGPEDIHAVPSSEAHIVRLLSWVCWVTDPYHC